MHTEIAPDTCDSGNVLSGDGNGLCQRPGTKRVRITGTGKAAGTYRMCQLCAGYWSARDRIVTIIGDLT